MKANMERGLLLGLGWVGEHLSHFSIIERGAFSSSFDKSDVARLKPLSELALTAWILKRCGIEIPFLNTVGDFIWDECDGGRRLVQLLLARNDFLPCCALYAPLYRIGYRCEALHVVLDMLARSDMAKTLPLQPWSHLALRYNLWNLELSCRPRGKGLYIQSRPEPWVVSSEVAYAITHETFYLTDFGFHPLRDDKLSAYLKTWVPYWAKVFAKEGNDDLAAEFAMVAGCLGGDLKETGMATLAAVLDHQLPDGAVSGPEGAGRFLFAVGDSPERRSFLGRYHTTLVTLMACAMCLKAMRQSAVIEECM